MFRVVRVLELGSHFVTDHMNACCDLVYRTFYVCLLQSDPCDICHYYVASNVCNSGSRSGKHCVCVCVDLYSIASNASKAQLHEYGIWPSMAVWAHWCHNEKQTTTYSIVIRYTQRVRYLIHVVNQLGVCKRNNVFIRGV